MPNRLAAKTPPSRRMKSVDEISTSGRVKPALAREPKPQQAIVESLFIGQVPGRFQWYWSSVASRENSKHNRRGFVSTADSTTLGKYRDNSFRKRHCLPARPS